LQKVKHIILSKLKQRPPRNKLTLNVDKYVALATYFFINNKKNLLLP